MVGRSAQAVGGSPAQITSGQHRECARAGDEPRAVGRGGSQAAPGAGGLRDPVNHQRADDVSAGVGEVERAAGDERDCGRVGQRGGGEHQFTGADRGGAGVGIRAGERPLAGAGFDQAEHPGAAAVGDRPEGVGGGGTVELKALGNGVIGEDSGAADGEGGVAVENDGAVVVAGR